MTHEREKVQGGGEYAIPEPPDPNVVELWDWTGGRWTRVNGDGTLWARDGITWYWPSLLMEWGPLDTTAPPEPPR